ncbi:hypothetical protein A6C57_01195 [Fibrella sp. ES10-3-2-2]|nr:hypothetical protein A6C57_01195 [Fibrella sp. ES10-3-2-2]
MSELFQQLIAAPRDALYLLFIAVGALLAAVFIQASSPTEALKNLLFGLFGGLILLLIVTGYFPTWRTRYLLASSGLSGLMGNWAINLILTNRDWAGRLLVRYVQKKYGGDDASNQPPNS